MYYSLKTFFIISVFIISPVYAIDVAPMVVTFSPFETSKIPSSMVYNDLSRDIAFEVEVYEVEFDPLGLSEPNLILLEDSPLWVFPPLLFLKSGKSQRIQFRWLGEDVPETDKTYQVSLVEQSVANELDENKSKLTVLLNINLIVHIDQPKMLPKLSVDNAHIENSTIVAKVVNRGNGYSRLSDYDVTVYYSGLEQEKYYKGQLKAHGYDVFFPPRSSMYVRLPTAFSIDGFHSKELQVELYK